MYSQLEVLTSIQAARQQSTRQSSKHPVADSDDVDATVWWSTMMTAVEAMMLMCIFALWLKLMSFLMSVLFVDLREGGEDVIVVLVGRFRNDENAKGN